VLLRSIYTGVFAAKISPKNATMEHHVFSFRTDYRGHHRKGVAINNSTLVNLQTIPWFH